MAQGHLETLKNMETRLVKRNFSMSGLPLLSHFCVFFIIIIIIIISIIKQVYNSSSLVRMVNFSCQRLFATVSSEQGNFNALPHLAVEYADKVSGDLSRSLSRSRPVHLGSKKLISFKLFPWISLSLKVYEATLISRNNINKFFLSENRLCAQRSIFW